MRVELAYQTAGNTLAVAAWDGTQWSSETITPNVVAGSPALVAVGAERWYFVTDPNDGLLKYIVRDGDGNWNDAKPLLREDVYPRAPLGVVGSPTAGVINYDGNNWVQVLCRTADGQIGEYLGTESQDPSAAELVVVNISSGSDVAQMGYWESQLWLYEDPSGKNGGLVCFAPADLSAAGERPPTAIVPATSVTGAPSCVVSLDETMQPETVHLFYQGTGEDAGKLLYRTRPYDPDRFADYSTGWSDESFVPDVQVTSSPAAVYVDRETLWVFFIDTDKTLQYYDWTQQTVNTPKLGKDAPQPLSIPSVVLTED